MNSRTIYINPKALWLGVMVLFSVYAWRVDFLGGIALYKILFPLTFTVLFISKKINSSTIGKNLAISTYCWLAILCWGLFSFFWIRITGTEMNYITYDLNWVLISICFSVMTLKESYRDRLVTYFCVLAGVIGVMGWYTAFSGFYFNMTHVSYYYKKNFLGLYRPNAIFYNINDNAVFMFMSIVVLFLATENKRNSMFWRCVGMIIYGGNVLFVDSRGVELGVMIFLVVYLLNTKNIKRIYKALIIIGGVLFAGIFLENIMNLGLFSEGLNDSGRFSIIAMCLSSLARTHFMGVGPGNITTINASFFSVTTVAPHNFFIEIFCDYGVVGLIVIVIWFVSNLRCAMRMSRSDSRATIIWVAWLAFTSISIVSSSLLGKSWVACFFGIMIAYLNTIECRQSMIENLQEK